MRLIVALAILSLTACASQADKTAVYRDAKGGRGVAELERDGARCNYEMLQAANARPYAPSPAPYMTNPQMAGAAYNLGIASQGGPDLGLRDACMAARGWQLMGYE